MGSAIVTQLAVGRARLSAHQGHDSKTLILSTPSEPLMKQSHAISGHKDGRSRLAYNVIALRGNLAFLDAPFNSFLYLWLLVTELNIFHFLLHCPKCCPVTQLCLCHVTYPTDTSFHDLSSVPWQHYWDFFFLLDNWVCHGKGQGETDRICPVTNSNTCTLFDSNTCTI